MLYATTEWFIVPLTALSLYAHTVLHCASHHLSPLCNRTITVAKKDDDSLGFTISGQLPACIDTVCAATTRQTDESTDEKQAGEQPGKQMELV